MPPNIENRRARFYDRVIRLDVNDRPDAFFNEVMETGGIYTAPSNERWEQSKLFGIALHGVVGLGISEEEAISNWIRQARRVIRAEVSA